MNTFNAWCFVLLIIFVSAKSVSAIACYSCLTCNDPFDKTNATIIICKSVGCGKYKTIDGVVRSCALADLQDKCMEENTCEACICSADLCNSASGNNVSIIGLCLSIFVMFLWMK